MSRAAMKKTAVMFLYDVELHEWVEYGEITCEVRGEMADGTKVGVDLETEEQYFLYRYGRNHFSFVHS